MVSALNYNITRRIAICKIQLDTALTADQKTQALIYRKLILQFKASIKKTNIAVKDPALLMSHL